MREFVEAAAEELGMKIAWVYDTSAGNVYYGFTTLQSPTGTVSIYPRVGLTVVPSIGKR